MLGPKNKIKRKLRSGLWPPPRGIFPGGSYFSWKILFSLEYSLKIRASRGCLGGRSVQIPRIPYRNTCGVKYGITRHCFCTCTITVSDIAEFSWKIDFQVYYRSTDRKRPLLGKSIREVSRIRLVNTIFKGFYEETPTLGYYRFLLKGSVFHFPGKFRFPGKIPQVSGDHQVSNSKK